MEFGLFIFNYVPSFRREADPEAEHHAIMEDLEAVVAADKAGFKYVWVAEHHFLDEYSHLSANEVVLGYLAHATQRIHLGSGIFNPLPPVNHPVKVAERAAYLDHISKGRYEFGTGRGSSSHEILAFLPDTKDLSGTRAIWEETIGEFPKMWLQDVYAGFQGKSWSLPPRKVLPKPYGKAHPAMWYAAGHVSSFEMAGRKGLGVLGFSLGAPGKVEQARTAYKTAVARAEPIGAFANDNLMICTAAYVAEDERKARAPYLRARPNYLVSNVHRYHDTLPQPPLLPRWPQVLPDNEAMLDLAIKAGGLVCGDPEQALAQCKRWESTGIDQLVFGIGAAAIHETLETIRLLGKHVIPKIDTDPVHRTTRFRQAAGG